MFEAYIIVVIIYVISPCCAQIPKECGTNFTLKTGVCCPVSRINYKVCGSPDRGMCELVKFNEDEDQIFGFRDVRLKWPKQWFEYLCKCKGNYFGPSCDDCWYGWKGQDCSERHKLVRRNIANYNKTEKEQFVNILIASREEEAPYLLVKEAYRNMEESVVAANIHEVIVNIHFLAQRSIIANSSMLCEDAPHVDCAHAEIGFITFHRHFMLFWEKWCANLAKKKYEIENFSFPYWDWTDKKTCDICTNDLIGASGEISAEGSFYLSTGSPFHTWTVYCDLFSPKDEYSVNNCAPCSATFPSERLTRKVSPHMLPITEHVEFTLSRKAYAPLSWWNDQSECPAFAKALEGVCGKESWGLKHTMHDAVHESVSGPFSSSGTSPNDPLFIFHHTQIDRLFQRWWISHPYSAKKYPRTMAAGHCFLCNQIGFIPVVTHTKLFVDTTYLGYEYDSLQFGGI